MNAHQLASSRKEQITLGLPPGQIWIMHVADSKSGGWGIIKANQVAYFFHRRGILSGDPQVGTPATFTALPPGPNGTLKRATELSIAPVMAE